MTFYYSAVIFNILGQGFVGAGINGQKIKNVNVEVKGRVKEKGMRQAI